MLGIQIQLKGEVAFETFSNQEVEYRCDVPTDELGIPYLPLIEILKRDVPSFVLPEHIEVGFARPDGYIDLLRQAGEICSRIPNGKNRIRYLFTNEHFDPETGIHMRSLKSGQIFYAPLHVKDKELETVDRFLKYLTHAGVREKGITGEISCRACELPDSRRKSFSTSELLNYSALNYSLVLLAPTSIDAPYDDGDKTYPYIPGSELREALLAWQTDSCLKAGLPKMRFSNAYIAGKGARLLPVPMCMSVVKLDKEQLRYRLASGKDPDKVEQDVGLDGAFGDRFDQHCMQYVKPVVKRVISSSGVLYDALSEGQVFKGTIYGTDEQLRAAAAWIEKNPFLHLGALREEGYGQAYIVLDDMRESRLPMEVLSTCFDVSCLSHTLLYTDEGMPGTRPEDFLRELEYVTGMPGAFEIVGRYTNVYNDYKNCFGWPGDGPVTRCLKAGSVLRIRTKNGKAADISSILHTFIGENTRDGYGEIMAWPATEVYYRIAKEVVPRIYDINYEPLLRGMHLSARRVHEGLTTLFRYHVMALGMIDAADAAGGKAEEFRVPVEILSILRDRYDPEIDMEILEGWYREGLCRNINSKEKYNDWNPS